MATVTAETQVAVQPDRRMFGLADAAEADQPWPQVPHQPHQWVSASRSAILVGTGQDGVKVMLHLQGWDDGPPPDEPGDRAEVSATIRLHLPSGQLSVNEITGGWVPDVFTLPAPGDYHLRITGRQREETARAYDQLFTRYTVTDPDFEHACQALDGHEHYQAQFWPATPST